MLLDGMITNGIVYEMTVGHQDPSGHSVLWNAIAFERPEASNIAFDGWKLKNHAVVQMVQRFGSLAMLVSLATSWVCGRMAP